MRAITFNTMFALLSLISTSAFACSCIYSELTYDAVFDRATSYDVIFIGEIRRVDRLGAEGSSSDREWTMATFSVEEPLKGLGNTSEIQIFSVIGMCVAPFFEKQRYVVFARYDEDSGKLLTSSCGLDIMPSETKEDDDDELRSYQLRRLALLREVL